MNNTKHILDLIREAKEIRGTIVAEGQGRRREFDVDYWNAQAKIDEDIPDIVLFGRTFTIFYDDLADAKVHENKIQIFDKEFEIIK